MTMKVELNHCLTIFPVVDLEKTAAWYADKLGFRAVKYLDVDQPHVCLYRDGVEIVLTKSTRGHVEPNRERYGSGEDGYFICDDADRFAREAAGRGVTIVCPAGLTDYGNRECVFEDCDGRWIAVGMKVGK